MMKRFFLTLMVSAFLLLPFSVRAVDLEKSFEVSFEFDGYGLMVVNSYDDNGIVDGYIVYDVYDKFCSKYDLNDRLVWKKTDLTMNDFKVVSDNNDLVIKKINTKDNSIIWQEKFGGNGNEQVGDVFYDYDTKDNVTGYLIIVTTDSTDLDVEPGNYIMKYDLNGKLLWIKSLPVRNYSSVQYLKNKNGDWIEFSTYHGSHGIVEFHILNKATHESILSKYYSMRNESNLISNGEYVTFILCDNDSSSTKLFRYDSDGQVVFEKQLELIINSRKLINSKTIDGKNDGFISINYSNLTNNTITKFDCDGNLIWNNELAYELTMLTENYDEFGNFNGYIVVGYDRVNKKGYITKFTYPKKVIESKNNDVEVLDYTYPGKVVTLKPKEKAGYFVKRVIVRDSSGKEIEVSNNNTFVMPDDDVSIEVIYEKRETEPAINPDTASTISVILVLVSIVVFGTVLIRVTVLNKSM